MKNKTIPRISISTVTLFGVVVTACAPPYGEPATSFVLRALAAEEQATKKRANLSVRRGHNDTRYVIERISPDKLHMRWKDGDHEQELYVIGNRVYSKGPVKWTVTRGLPQLTTPLSVVGLFKDALENLKEEPPVTTDGVKQRVFKGTIAWFSGRHHNAGELRIFIETVSALPRLIVFKGTCGPSECSFEHRITYEPTIAIEAPVH